MKTVVTSIEDEAIGFDRVICRRSSATDFSGAVLGDQCVASSFRAVQDFSETDGFEEQKEFFQLSGAFFRQTQGPNEFVEA